MTFRMPPAQATPSGAPRRAGFELEFTGVGLPAIVQAVRRAFGGEPRAESRFVHKVACQGLGDFSVFMDWVLLKHRGYEDYLRALGLQCPADCALAEDVIETMAATLVPYEVVTPPLPLAEAPRVETLRQALQEAGALGTTATFYSAFGLHINVEAARLDAAGLLAVLRAFMLLRDYIAEETGVVLTRRLSRYIDPFPDTYMALVLDPAYAPDITGLIRDYLEHNPTRNRGLDMLPIFAGLDRELVLSYPVEADKLKPRPAFHYRLPNCRVDDPAWRIADEWNHWVDIEELAASPAALDALSRAWLARPLFPLSLFEPSWPEVVRAWRTGR